MIRAIVVGGGLAGSEAAIQLSRRGVKVKLYEMRPKQTTPAHKTEFLAELVCSNSLKSQELNNGHGLLKEELKILRSAILAIAFQTRVEAGKSLSVDRLKFAKAVTEQIKDESNIEVINDEVVDLPNSACIIATGPLTSEQMALRLENLLGRQSLFFYDAISPIVSYESIDLNKTFRGSRYGFDKSYINCPIDKDEYDRFCDALLDARTYPFKDFEKPIFFEGCMPIEELLRRGRDTLRFGALKPVGFDKRYYSVLQLRPENLEGTMYSMVGCQTKLLISEQERVFRLVPALGGAHFLRYGSVHRNTYIMAPESLLPTLQTRPRSDLFLAGQITGVEGYVESIAIGLLAGINLYRYLSGQSLTVPPPGTMLGGLVKYLTTPNSSFAPMSANFGLLPYQKDRTKMVADSLNRLKQWVSEEKI